MLNINIQKNQSVNIGETGKLTVTGIDNLNDEVLVTFVDDSIDPPLHADFAITIGHEVKLMQNVTLHFKSIGRTGGMIGTKYVNFGFEAPRRIVIKGNWARDVHVPKTLADLGQMGDSTLIYYANMHAATPLERELFKRFKEVLS